LLLTTVALLALRRYRLRPTSPEEGGTETPADVGAADVAAEGQPG
jgi:hypothetical protein